LAEQLKELRMRSEGPQQDHQRRLVFGGALVHGGAGGEKPTD